MRLQKWTHEPRDPTAGSAASHGSCLGVQQCPRRPPGPVATKPPSVKDVMTPLLHPLLPCSSFYVCWPESWGKDLTTVPIRFNEESWLLLDPLLSDHLLHCLRPCGHHHLLHLVQLLPRQFGHVVQWWTSSSDATSPLQHQPPDEGKSIWWRACWDCPSRGGAWAAWDAGGSREKAFSPEAPRRAARGKRWWWEETLLDGQVPWGETGLQEEEEISQMILTQKKTHTL